MRPHVGQETSYDFKLVKPRPDLCTLLLAGFRIERFDELRVVLKNVRQAIAREKALPEVVGLRAVRIRRIASAVVPTLVERQEPRSLADEMRAEAHLVFVEREMRDASAKREQLLSRVTVALVLLDSVGDRLLREAVFQLERDHR